MSALDTLEKAETHASLSLGSVSSVNPAHESATAAANGLHHIGTGKQVSWIVSLAVRAPIIFLSGIIGLSLLCTYFVLPFVDLSDPLAGLRLREDDYARKADSLASAYEVEIYEFWEGDEREREVTQQSKGEFPLSIMYFTPDNVFTPERLKAISRFESKLRAVDGFQDHCLKDEDTFECLNFISPIVEIGGTNFTTQEEVNDAIINAWNDGEGKRKFFTKEFNPETNQTASHITRTTIYFGLPLAGYRNTFDREEEQYQKLGEWLNGGIAKVLQEETFDDLPGMRLIYVQDQITTNMMIGQMFQDVQKCIIAAIAILCIMIVHMRSLFLASLGMVQIILSFPIAFFIYRIFFGLRLFGALHGGALFIVLGVGADDCFIYIDSFKLADSFGWSLEKRMSFAYDKAKFTMLVTTFTNAFAFLSLSTSAIPMIRYFGVFSFLLIVVNYLLVMTMFTCLIVIWDKYIRTKSGFSNCKSRPGPRVSSQAESSNGSSDDALGKLDMEKRSFLKEAIVSDNGSKCIMLVFGIISTVFGILSFRLNLSPSLNELDLFWPEDHMINVFVTSESLFYGVSEVQTLFVHILTGIEEPYINRTGTDELERWDLGVPYYVEPYLLSHPAIQEFLSYTCREVFRDESSASNLKLTGPGESSAACFMLAFELWREARVEPFPVPNPVAVAPVINLTYPEYATTSSDTFEEAMMEFFGRPFFEPLRVQILFERALKSSESAQKYEALKAKMAYQSFVIHKDPNENVNSRLDTAKAWEGLVDRIIKRKPDVLKGDIYFTEGSYFVDMQRQLLLIVTAFSALFLALLLAFGFMILATNNIKITLISLGCICGIVIVMFGFLTVIGWGMDLVTSIALTILVGFSIDYVVHFAVSFDEAYREQGIIDKKDKVRFALSTMSGSIIAGAASTLTASIMLFPTVIVIFGRFGAFLCTAVSIAILFASFLLPALLARYGPNGGNGKLSKRLEIWMTKHGSIYLETCHEPRTEKQNKTTTRLCVSFFVVSTFLIVVAWAFRVVINPYEFTAEELFSPRLNENNNSIRLVEMSPNSWYKVNPGGNTTCGRGGPFSFFVKRGSEDSDQFLIEFEGGGICWNANTCRAKAKAFNGDLSFVDSQFGRVGTGEGLQSGIMDENGPFYENNYIFIPMCTGDFHWGSKTTKYSETVSVSHMGSVNALSVLEWLFDQTVDVNVTQLSVVGVDSGAYASLVYSGIISTWLQFTASDIHLTQHGDGGLGIFFPDWIEEVVQAWGLRIEEFRSFAIENDANNTIPSWLVIPDGIIGLGNFTDLALVNQTQLRACLESENAVPVLGDFGDFINGNLPQEVQDCLDSINSTEISSLFQLNQTAFNQSQAQRFKFLNLTFNSANSFGLTPDIINALLDREECNVEDSEQLTNNPERCINTQLLKELNISVDGFNISDFTSFETDTNVQIIPSMYMLFSYRFPEYEWSQTSTAYDYEQASAAASQVLGFVTPVTVNEQNLWNEIMTALYDFYLPLMPDNYYHYTVSGDLHGFIPSNRYYRLVENKFYQIMYSWVNQLGLHSSLPTRFDCRNQANSQCNSTGLDERTEIVYFTP